MAPSPAVHPLRGTGARTRPPGLPPASSLKSPSTPNSIWATDPAVSANISIPSAPLPLSAAIANSMESIRRQHESHRSTQQKPTTQDDMRSVQEQYESMRPRQMQTKTGHVAANVSQVQVLGKRSLEHRDQSLPPMQPSPQLPKQAVQMHPRPQKPNFFATPPASPAVFKKPAVVDEVIDVDDDDAMELLFKRNRPHAIATANSIAPIAISPDPPSGANWMHGVQHERVGDNRYVDAGGNLYSVNQDTGRIEISDSPAELNASSIVGTLPRASMDSDWTPGKEDHQIGVIPELHDTPPFVQRFMNVPPPTRQPAFLAPKNEGILAQPIAFHPASSIPSSANFPPINPPAEAIEFNYSHRGGPGDELCSKEKLQDLVKANALTADATEEEETPTELNITLMPHQRRALKWMAKRENLDDDDDKGSDEDIIAVSEADCRGGILADEQGLGKTLSVLALLLKNKPKPTKREPEPAWRTLIVCPLSLVSQWKEEIESRIRDDYIPSIHVYHGPKREKNWRVLENYDIVLTTYTTLAKEYPKINKDHRDYEARKEAKLDLPRRKAGCAFRVKWRRVVLDEAHYVKNRRTDNFNAVTSLKAQYRWCLTGTPIQNSVDDIYALFVFIKYDFVPNYELWNMKWKKRLENSVARIREKAFKCFQAIVGVVLLRRTKNDTIDGKPLIVLPERKSEVLEHTFDDNDEKSFYKAVQEKSVVAVNKFLVAGTLAHNYSSVLLLLLRLRQACCHPFLIEYAGLIGKRGKKSREDLTDFHSPYSDIALDEAVELVVSGHSLVSLLEEGVRNTVKNLLAPTKENMLRQDHFTCTKCRLFREYHSGSALQCGHFMCNSCGGQSVARGLCLVCANLITLDRAEALINLNELRMEVHAIVRTGLLQDDNMYDLPTATSLRAILKSRGNGVLSKSPKRQRHKQASLDSYFGIKDSGSGAGASALAAFVEAADDEGEVEQTPRKREKKREANLSAFEDISDDDDDGDVTDDDDDFVPMKSSKKEESTIVGAGVDSDDDDDDDDDGDDENNARLAKLELEEMQIGAFYPEATPFGNQLNNGGAMGAKTETMLGITDESTLGIASAKTEPMISGNAGPSNALNNPVKNENKVSNQDKDKDTKPLSVTEKLVRAVSQPSTKIRVLLEELAATRARGKNEKTLVFSQWTTMLDIVEFHVEGAGFGVCRLDGTMQMASRKEQIREFNTNEDKTVFLISLHAGGTGLNLTAACQVILCDVWWNPQTEEQAIDRVHRIGQKNNVRVCRFKMAGTVEDRIYDICARKKELSDGMLGVTGAQTMGRKKLSLAEIMYMFGGAAMDVERDAAANPEAAEAAKNILNYTGRR